MQRRLEAALGQDGRVDAAGELAQLLDAAGELADGFVEQLRQLAVRRRLALCQPKMKGDTGEAALRAVVQVALEAPALARRPRR